MLHNPTTTTQISDWLLGFQLKWLTWARRGVSQKYQSHLLPSEAVILPLICGVKNAENVSNFVSESHFRISHPPKNLNLKCSPFDYFIPGKFGKCILWQKDILKFNKSINKWKVYFSICFSEFVLHTFEFFISLL